MEKVKFLLEILQQKFFELTNEFSEVAEYKVNIKNKFHFYTITKYLKEKQKKTI